VDVITPDMNVGSTASISVSGNTFHFEIKDPDGQVIESRSGNSTFDYDLTAQKAGQHTITINNTGTSDLTIAGHAQTKSSPFGLVGSLMLVVTGIITIGLGLRFRRH
jgi:VCBS repeat-containing protein